MSIIVSPKFLEAGPKSRAWGDDLVVVLFEFLEEGGDDLNVECHKDVNSNKLGCGSPVKAQATARVDVPTGRVFPVWTMEANMSRMLGYVLVGQPTVILRVPAPGEGERLDMHLSGNRP